jgi:nitronate monooxygenase
VREDLTRIIVDRSGSWQAAQAGSWLGRSPATKAASWAADVRSQTNGSFQINLWIPDPAPRRDSAHEERVREFLGQWGPAVAPEAGNVVPIEFADQCEAMLDVGPATVSSIMGLYPSDTVARMKEKGIRWLANVTTVAEAQGMEAGGHRGSFDAERADTALIGLFALLPAVVDAIGDRVPVVATGGIADARGIAAALLLGASAVQIGTGLLRTPEAKLTPAWADAIGKAQPEDTLPTRAFSGRLGRSVATAYVKAANAPEAPKPAPYPVQRALSQAMRDAATKADNIDAMQAWAGQAARLATTEPAADLVRRLWSEAQALLTTR